MAWRIRHIEKMQTNECIQATSKSMEELGDHSNSNYFAAHTHSLDREGRYARLYNYKVQLIAFVFALSCRFINQAGRCAYAVAIMAIYWMTEAIPIAVTALLPFVSMPWLGVIKSSEVAVNYLKVSIRHTSACNVFPPLCVVS